MKKIEPKLDDDQSSYFIVTSHGWSGSHWLAIALDSHPDIICAHSALNAHARGADSSLQFLQKSVASHGKAVLGRGDRSIDDLFDQIRTYGETGKAFGNVHTLRLRDLLVINKKFPTPRQHTVMNLIRHPVSVVASGHGQLASFMEWDIFTLIDTSNCVNQQIDFALDLADRHQLNLCDPNVRAFLAASYHQMFLARDQEIAPEAPTIIMERVTTEPEYFNEVVRQLSSSRVDCDASYLDHIFDLGPLNPHKKGPKMSPAEQYASWNYWQQEAFKYMFTASRLAEYYPKFGYDFSFL